MPKRYANPATPIRILHLEDSDLDAELVRDRLERSSLRVTIERAVDRHGFMAKLQSQGYDLILSDYQVPTFDGLVALDLAKEHHPETPFIFVSGAMGEELAVETLKRGATDYVLKDRLARLELAIERALREAHERAERKRAETTARKTLTLLEGIAEGTEELIAAIDPQFRFSLVNHAYQREFRRLFGTEAVVGSGLLELLSHLPDDQARAKDLWGRALAGESFTVTAQFGDPTRERRTFDLRFYPIFDDSARVVGAAEIASDVTERNVEERRQQFLVNLAIETQSLTDPEAITTTSAQRLAEYLHADRCAYAEIEDDTQSMVVGDCASSGLSIVGRWHVADFGEQCIAKMQANEPFVVCDSESDLEIAPEQRQVYRDLGVRAVICVPLVKEGRFRSAMAIHQQTPRQWTIKEIELVQIAVGRCWEAIERARALRQLQASEERFRTLVMTTSSVIWKTDSVGAIVAENPSWEEFTGQSPAEYEGWGWLRAVHSDDRELTDRMWAEALREKKPYATEYRLRRHDGQYRYVVARGAPVLDAQGAAREWIGSCVDVTDRKQKEAELAESEQRYRLVADAANDAIWDWEVASDQIRWNEGVRTNFGYAIQDVQSNTRWWSERIHPDDVEQVLADVHRHLESDSDTWQGEYRFRRADGTYAYVFDRGRIVRNADRRPLRMVGSMLDLTLRRQAEQDLARLLAEEKRHAALLNRVAAAARSVNSILSAESIARIVAEESSSILGASAAMTTWIAASDAQQHVVAANSNTDDLDAQLTARVCKDNQPLRISSSVPGQRSCARLAVPLAAHGGKNLGAVQLARRDGRDFSSEDELVLQQLAAVASAGIENARLYEQVREQDRRKDEFLATLAHELRNPLAPIRTGLSVLRLAPPEERLAPEILEVMERQVEHMVRLIDDLLDVSRITRGMVELKRGHIEVRKIFDAAIEVSRSIIEAADHQLIVSIPDEPLVIDADATRMAQVISNLLNNAAKYTPHGGRIELSAQREGHDLTILVRDNGTGIAPEMLSKVFEMFTQVGHTLELAQGGLGIGLGLVSKLVAMHGGTVTAQSDGLDQGSLFTVRLPLAVGESTAMDIARSGSTTTPPQVISRRILVVDDNTDGAQVLSLLLERAGHTTSMAHNGRTALEVARQFRPEVVFLDIGLPEMNGYEVAQRLRAEYGSDDLTLVALTGWGTEADRRRSRDAGFDHHFTKPVDAAHVQAMLAGL